MKKYTNLNIENLKESALKRATAKTYFAIGLLILSLIAALGITGKANRSVGVWSAASDLVAGDRITPSNAKEIKVFLPGGSARYLPIKSKIVNFVVTKRVNSGELIPASAVSENFQGGNLRSVPLRITRNDLPIDLVAGETVDIYALPKPELTLAKLKGTELISEAVTIESIDSKSKDMGGDIGIVIKIPSPNVISLLSSINNSRIVVVRNAI
jgi:hypothetical protein